MSESVGVRRARVLLRLKEFEVQAASIEYMRRVKTPGAFAPEEVELAQIALERAKAARDLADLDLEEVLAQKLVRGDFG